MSQIILPTYYKNKTQMFEDYYNQPFITTTMNIKPNFIKKYSLIKINSTIMLDKLK